MLGVLPIFEMSHFGGLSVSEPDDVASDALHHTGPLFHFRAALILSTISRQTLGDSECTLIFGILN
jgi:hypothetical protein